jgi:hypothetical protein
VVIMVFEAVKLSQPDAAEADVARKRARRGSPARADGKPSGAR